MVMDDNLKKILTSLNKDIEQEDLLKYVNKDLPQKEIHELEQQMTDDDFTSDAAEGLQNIANKKDIPLYLFELDKKLQKKIAAKKNKHKKRILPNEPWVYFTAILLLLLAVIGFVVINKFVSH
jgi:hypothetical protein